MNHHFKKLKKGFTLLEMIVAVGVFAVVAVIAVSSLLTLIDAQRKAAALQTVQDNLRFTLEAMARDIRQGDYFYCGATSGNPSENPFINPPAPGAGLEPDTRDCLISGSGGSYITFQSSLGEVVTFRWGGGTAPFSSCDPDGSGHRCIERLVRSSYDQDAPTSDIRFFPVTARDLEIRNFKFYVAGASTDPSDNTEPRITIVLEGVSSAGRTETAFQLQTSVSQRSTFRR